MSTAAPWVTVSRLAIYPIKSCAGLEVDRLVFDAIGPVNDRRYMVVRPDGRFLTQRQVPSMARVTPALTDAGLVLHMAGQSELGTCELKQPDHQQWRECQVWKDQTRGLDCGNEVAAWLEAALGQAVRLVYMPYDVVRPVDSDYAQANDRVGFADGFPVLVTHQASADFLSDQLQRELAMMRFRPNVVVSGGEAFDELQWKTLQAEQGASSMHLVKPCTRCVIPLRNPQTLEREADVTELLKQHCRIGKEIIFGQNALLRDVEEIVVGSRWQALP